MVEKGDKPPVFGDKDNIKEFPLCKGARRGDPRFKEHDLEEVRTMSPGQDSDKFLQRAGGPRRFKCSLCGDEFSEREVPKSYWDD